MVLDIEGEMLFSSVNLSQSLNGLNERAKQAVSKIDPDEFLQRPHDNVVEGLIQAYRLERTRLHRDATTAPRIQETTIDVRHDIRRAVRDKSRPCNIPAARISLRAPFSGPNAFSQRASQHSMSPPHGHVDEGMVIVSRTIPSDTLEMERESVIRDLHHELDKIERGLSWIEADLDKWEPEFRQAIGVAAERRRSDLLTMRQTESMLGVPIERDGAVAATYTVSIPTRRPLPRPVNRLIHEPFQPEPAISEQDFANIVGDIGRVLVMFERLSLTHSEAAEERRRDQIIVTLHGIYGAGSAESFSKRGKTDIYLPWNDNAVFLAECKWWRGQKAFTDSTLPQLLDRYIVWRDTHTAMVLFIKNKDVSSVTEKSVESVRRHPRYVSDAAPISGFKTFILHQKCDESRQLRLALLTAAIIS